MRVKERIDNNRKTLMWVGYILSSVFVFAFMSIIISGLPYEYKQMSATLSLLDSNFYIGTRTFVGTVLSIFFDRVSVNGLFTMNTIFTLLAFVAVVIISYMAVRFSIKEEQYGLYFAALMLLLCPVGVIRYSNWIGAYNINNCLLTAIMFLVIDKKGLKFLCPILCLFAVFTHYSFSFIFFPAIISAMFYYAFSSGKVSSKINMVLTFAVTFLSSVYCAFFAEGTIRMTRDELYSYMSERIGGGEILNKQYFDSYYFDYSGATSVTEMLKQWITKGSIRTFISYSLLYYLPIIAVIVFVWVTFFKKAEKKYEKISAVMFMGSVLINICLIFLIAEKDRWMADSVISQAMLIAFVSNVKGKDILIFEKNKAGKIMTCILSFGAVYYLIQNFLFRGIEW